MNNILGIPYSYLKGKLASYSAQFASKYKILKVFQKSKVVDSLDSIRNPPVCGRFELKNAYIPLTRRTLVRELLQDGSTVLPVERKNFEKVAVFLDRKLESQFQILQNEFSILSHPLDVLDHSEGISSPSLDTIASNSNGLDREFWFLRRLADIAPVAGFIEVPQKELQNACNSVKSKYHGLIAYVDPNDYDILRFWIRGFHPHFNANSACSAIFKLNDNSTTKYSGTKLSTIRKFSIRISEFVNTLTGTIRRSYYPNIHGYESLDSFATESDGFYFGRVLMCVRRKSSNSLDLKLFQNVPVTGVVHNSSFADNLLYLLPNLHTIPLSKGSRLVVLMSTITAASCIGVICPIAWIFNANYDLVFAWSMAVTTSAAATLSIIWARYWRAQTNLANNLKYMQYLCCQSSGLQSINILLKLAHEQEFKAALLTYALLLRPTESNTSLSPMQLGFRAESWIAKRLQPQSHISLPSSIGAPIANNTSNSQFSGGSGPLFDLSFDADRSLQILRRLDLVRGPISSPNAVDPATASIDIPNDLSKSIGLDPLWVVDPLGKESNSRLSK
ncbi:transmembrane-lke protein isoform 1 [Schistosoma japonicum]|uniref:Transmembrane-lke protein isoform 1 n=1 Tax=Schistosoma japonicum TaxID=6182 RepID=A0A4Z2DDY7_SCHJA|nr:transmembrane-lke protein isoform 1 [Schistosoma japonicum]